MTTIEKAEATLDVLDLKAKAEALADKIRSKRRDYAFPGWMLLQFTQAVASDFERTQATGTANGYVAQFVDKWTGRKYTITIEVER